MQITFTYYRENDSFFSNYGRKLRLMSKLLAIAHNCGIDGFTLIPSRGAWKGKTEPSYLLQLEDVPHSRGLALARRLKVEFQQEAVMVKSATGKVAFV